MSSNFLDDFMGKPPRRKRAKKPRKKEEQKVSHQMAMYMALQYPKISFRFDVAADVRLTIGQATIISQKLLHKRGYQDLTILEARGGYFGLLIELKKDKSEVYTKDGKLKKKWNRKSQSDHNLEQHAHLETMRLKGYRAIYGFGFEHSKTILDDYMKLPPTKILLQTK